MSDQPSITTTPDDPARVLIRFPEITCWIPEDNGFGADLGVPTDQLPGLRDAIDKHLATTSRRREPAPACGEECAEGRTYAGRCELAAGACRSGQHQDHPGETCRDVETTDEATARTTADNPAASSTPWRWAETIGAHGTGDTRTIDIDIQQGDEEPVPVEIRHADAVTLHAMLGDTIHDQTQPDGERVPSLMLCGNDAASDGPPPRYPHPDGDVTVLGPEIFASNDGAVISWKGENYLRQGDPAASNDGLREQLAATIRDAACTRDEPHSEEECVRERIQPVVYHHGILAEVSGTPEMFATAVLAVRDAELQQARETNRRLNLRCQQAESALATFKRSVGEWEVSERGTYVPLRTVTAIAEAAGRDIDDGRYELHYQRVEAAEAKLTAVRDLLAEPRSLIDRARLEAALNGPATTPNPDTIRAAHQPVTRGDHVYCRTCSGWNGQHYTGTMTDHPCPTLRTLDTPADSTKERK